MAIDDPLMGKIIAAACKAAGYRPPKTRHPPVLVPGRRCGACGEDGGPFQRDRKAKDGICTRCARCKAFQHDKWVARTGKGTLGKNWPSEDENQ